MRAYSYHNQRFVDWMIFNRINRSKLTIQVVSFNLCVWIISNPVKFSESETQTKVIFKAKRGPQQKWNLEFESYQILKCHHKRKVGQNVCGWWWCILSWSWPLLNLLLPKESCKFWQLNLRKVAIWNLNFEESSERTSHLCNLTMLIAREKLLRKCEKWFSSQLFKLENIDRK